MRIRLCVSSVAVLVLIVVMFLAAWTFGRGQEDSGKQASPALQGLWTASGGSEEFHGKWTAVTSSRTPDFAYGAWVLQNGAGDIVLQGTWSARKSREGWRGTWSAHVNNGEKYSGNWTASEPGPLGKTFTGMLEEAAREEALGTWSTGQFGGSWSLKRDPWAK
jgi:hypothetical protein